jgi:cytochrome c biogenesis protein CcdA/thiol-disulfide isomerase/thioredoxin
MILLVLTYLAGVLTILSPCILPVLPFVFSKAQGSFFKNGLPLLIGMALTFSLLSGVAILGGEWIGKANEIGRVVAMVLMSLFGLSLLFPRLSEAVFAPLTRFGSSLANHGQSAEKMKDPKDTSLGESLVIGASTGLLWAPCAGPILGIVLTGAAAQGNTGNSILLLLSYSLGAATSLGLALIAGNRFLKTLKKFLGVDQVVKKVIGVAVLLGVVAIAFNLDRTVLTRISKIGTESFENKLLALGGLDKKEDKNNDSMMMGSGGGNTPVIEGVLPELDGAVSWINSQPLTIESLRGKVVLIDFWTYSCINCLRTLPYLKAWYEKYKSDGFVIIGVHTPEFAFEKNPENVKKAVADLGITYPVAVDSNYKIWNAFKNQYWPAHYFVDRLGRIRHHHFGEGEYDQSEDTIRKLLSENGQTIQTKTALVDAQGAEAPALLTGMQSPETYIGYARAEHFVPTIGTQKDHVDEYKAPKQLQLNEWTLAGKWKLEKECAIAQGKNSRIIYRFHARDLHLVLGGQNIEFKVKIDGHTPGGDHGVDIDEDGKGRIQGQRLYQLIRQKDPTSDHTFEIEFLSPGAEAYAFTFG